MRKIHIKRLAAFLSAVLIVTALAGCAGATSLPRPTPSAGAQTYSIAGSCTISQSGNVITVSGTIDVIEGTKVNVSVVAQDSRILVERTIGKTSGDISEQFTLTAEQMEGVVDMQGFICCAPSFYEKQPSEVYDKYGKKFENITNGLDTAVWSNEGVVLTFASDWLYGPYPVVHGCAHPVARGDAGGDACGIRRDDMI